MATDLPPLTPASPILPPVANFWTRAFALIIDIALLSFIFFYIAKLGYTSLYPARWLCDFIAFLNAFGYFAICSSRLTNGQTLGKRLLGIRVISLTAPELSLGQAVLRGALVHLIILAYLFLPRFLMFMGYGQFAQFLFFNPGLLLPGISLFTVLVPVIIGYIALAYTLSNAVFCGLGPKKLSYHDLLAHTAVARVGDEDRAREMVGQFDDMDQAKRKAAIWPSIIIAAIVLFVFAVTLFRAFPEFNKEFPKIKSAKAALNIPGFRLAGLEGPSEEAHQRYLQNLKRYEEAVEQAKNNPNANRRQMPALTTETLQYAPTGRKFVFSFECEEDFTSQSLVADPRYRQLIHQLPEVAEQLSKNYFKNAAGQPETYTEIQADFIEVFPLYLYSRMDGVWRVVFPIDSAPAPISGIQAIDEQQPKASDQPEPR